MSVSPPNPGPQAPASAQKQAYQELSEFTLALTQAMLRTGYYSMDHPEAEKSVDGLYNLFRETLGERPELAYLITRTRDQRDLAIEGYEPVPLSVQQVMFKGMADLFCPKLLGFFDRWRLISFAIGQDCTPEEFNTFIALMSAPPAESGATGASERLKQAFVEADVRHISLVFKDDIVGRERRLPWRVEMALSRLRKDLTMLPLYKGATREQLQRTKLQIIDDVIRPIRTPALLKEFLVNYDLVAADINILEEAQVEREIVLNLSEEILIQIARSLDDELLKFEQSLNGRPKGELPEEAMRRLYVLKEITDRLSALNSLHAKGYLEALIDRGVITLDDLPPEVKQTLQKQRLAEAFSARSDQFIGALGALEDGPQLNEVCLMIRRVFEILKRRGDYATVSNIRATAAARAAKPDAPSAITELSTFIAMALANRETLSVLLEDIRHPDKETRDCVVDLIGATGPAAAKGLLGVYRKSEARAVRMSVFDALSLIGTDALVPLVTHLDQIEKDWGLVRHIVAAVGDRGDAALAEPILQLRGHENAHVRHAVLVTLLKLQGAEAEMTFVRALRDPEAEVRQTAVACLRKIGSSQIGALEFYASVLEHDDQSGESESDAVLLEVCGAMAAYAESPPEVQERAERILLDAVITERGKGLLGVFKRPHLKHSERVAIAICDALAHVGGSNAILPLRKLEASQRGPLGEKAGEAADAILRRTEEPAPSES